MRVNFILHMQNAVVNGKSYDELIIDWFEEMNWEEVNAVSQKWLKDHNFLTSRMSGLTRVSDSSLSIEPMEEAK